MTKYLVEVLSAGKVVTIFTEELGKRQRTETDNGRRTSRGVTESLRTKSLSQGKEHGLGIELIGKDCQPQG